MSEKPTDEQRVEFWERCGFEWHKEIELWHDPIHGLVSSILPPIDLNNLFKYAVPVAIDKIMTEQECSSDLAYAILFKKWLQRLELDIPSHEITLFYTIQEVFNDRPTG